MAATDLRRSADVVPVAEASTPAPTSHPAVLTGLCTALLAAMAWFAWSLPGSTARQARPSTSLARRVGVWSWMLDHLAPPSSPGWLAVMLVTSSVVAFGAWFGIVALTRARSDPKMVRMVLLVVTFGVAIGVTALPNQTSDIYDYALFGRVVSAHDGRAYHDLPDRYPDDPLYRVASHRYTGHPDNKLPVWTASAVAVSFAAGDDPLTTLLAFRAFLGASTIATALLVARVLRRVRPDAVAGGVAAFGLCPIVLAYGASKTDAFMVLLMVGAVASAIDGRDRTATVLASLSVLVKAITLPVLVLVVAAPPVHRRLGRSSERSASVTAIAERASLAVLVCAVAFSWLHRPTDVLRRLVTSAGTGTGTVLPAGHRMLTIAFLVLVASVSVGVWRSSPVDRLDRSRRLILTGACLLTAFAVVLTRPGLAWYLISAIAMVAVAGSRLLFRVVASLGGLSFLLGWWGSVSTSQHPLPDILPDRPLMYLAVAGAVSLTAVATHHRRGRHVLVASPSPDPAA